MKKRIVPDREPFSVVEAEKLTGILFAAILAGLTVACAAGGPTVAPASRLILPEGGTVVEQGGRVDLYDAKSNRTGYGYVRGDGSVDVFNVDGSRRATIAPGIGGQPARIVVPRR
jgi:hypothetical protein